MTNFAMLFEVSGAVLAVGGVAFFLVLAAVAFVAYRMLRKTLKWALRMTIVGVILIVALVGGIAMIWFGASSPPPRRSEPTRQR